MSTKKILPTLGDLKVKVKEIDFLNIFLAKLLILGSSLTQ
jgi:hypothetical protein